MNALFIIIKVKRSTLFKESNEIKPQKYNELKFFDVQIEIFVNLEKLWQEKESFLITTINVMKRRFNISKENSSTQKQKLRCKKRDL